MEQLSDNELADFITTKSLYTKVLACQTSNHGNLKYDNPLDFTEKAFRLICPIEKQIQTFRTALPYGGHLFGRGIYDAPGSDNNLPIYFDEKSGMLDLTTHIKGICQSCHTSVHYLIRSYSDKKWSERSSGIKIFIQKTGQYPPLEVKPDKIVEKYLTEEDLSLYKKAVTSLSFGYGIGAFAYFRRIIENEIKRIIKDISSIEFDGAENIRKAYLLFETNHQMSSLITTITPYLPPSLLIAGDNPIQLLYKQLSEGIHALLEEECLERATLINVILPFVIKKVNEEKFQMTEVVEAMKKLRNT